MKAKRGTTETPTLRRAYKFRAYPNKGTRRRLWNAMRRAATPVWNACIAEREAARQEYARRVEEGLVDIVYERRRDVTEAEEKAVRKAAAKEVHWPTAFDQYKHVRKSDHPEYAPYSASMLECVVAKVDGSEKSFLALWTKGRKDARPPQQEHLHRCLTFRKSGWKLDGDRLWLMAVGTIRIRMHRPILGKIKTVTVTQTKTGKWFVCFSCEIKNFSGACGPVPPVNPALPDTCGRSTLPSGGSDPEKGGTHNSALRSSDSRVGGSDPEKGGTHNLAHEPPPIFVGGSDPEKAGAVEIMFPSDLFIYDSEGREIAHPRFYGTEAETLARLNQSLGRKAVARPGMKNQRTGDFRGRNRRKARRLLAKWHEHIAAKRDYWLWHVARFYAASYKTVVVNVRPIKEKIQYAVTSEEALRLCDGAYARFVTMLRQKCEEFGTEFVERKGEWYDRDKEHAGRVEKYERDKRFVREVKKAIKRGNRTAVKQAVRRHKVKRSA